MTVRDMNDVKIIEKYTDEELAETPLLNYATEFDKHMEEIRKLTYFSHLVVRINEAKKMAEELKELVDRINLDPSVLSRIS
ncbi:MAG: hypothetical protein IJV70_01295 [Clostridia bacterium]|nr:hypothetical protein [Clostridia bacterium]